MSARLRLIAACAIAGLLASCGEQAGGGQTLARGQATITDLEMKVSARGTLTSLKPVYISPKAQGKVAWVVAEGTRVAKGDKLLEIENKEVAQQLVQLKQEREAALRSAENAQRELELQQLEAQKQVSDAALALENAKRAAEQYLKGKAPLQEQDLRLALEKAETEAADVRDKATRMPTLLEKGFVTPSEARLIELENREKSLAVDKKRRELEIFLTYDHPNEKAKLENEATNAALACQRVAQQVATQRDQKAAEIERHRAMAEQLRVRLEGLAEQEAALILKAPQDGMVVYGSGDLGISYGRSQLEVGGEVYQNQVIMTLPDLSQMVASVAVNELEVTRVKPGLRTVTRVEGLGERAFTGTVTKTATTASQNWRRGRDAKEYLTVVSLGDTAGADFRPGMTAVTEIHLAKLERVLTLPIDLVATRGEEHYCWVEAGGGLERRTLRLGEANDDRVVIAEGLAEGETVVVPRTEPASAATAP